MSGHKTKIITDTDDNEVVLFTLAAGLPSPAKVALERIESKSIWRKK